MSSGNSTVYTGAWTNWADGRVKGATVTLTTLHGSYLIAFLAVFVRLVGSHFWQILSWFFFHARTTNQAQDGLHHQQQALLANDLSDSSAIWQFTRLGWHWRKRARNVFWRTSGFIVVALAHFCAFTAAGIFSASVTSTRSEVLLREGICGNYSYDYANNDPTSLATRQASTRLSAINVAGLRSAYQYATSCYDQTSLDNVHVKSCNAYGRKDVDWTLEMVDDCPFHATMCTGKSSARFDTGPVDSALVLGINAEPKDRITMRNVMHCSPITTEEFASGPYSTVTGLVANYPDPRDLNTWTQYAYGENTATQNNATFSFNNESVVTSQGGFFDYRAYILDSEIYVAGTEFGSFIPIPQLKRADADIILFFLTKAQTAYYTPVNDPFFQSNLKLVSTSIEESTSQKVTSIFYAPEEPVGVMGCAVQWQYCNAATKECSVLSGNAAAVADIDKRDFMSIAQKATTDRIQAAGKIPFLMTMASSYLGSSFMVASSLISATVGDGLPDNQWVVELNHWLRIGFTAVQIELGWWVTGDGVALHDKYKAPATPAQQFMCKNQLVQRDDYASFSVLGIALILILGGLIIIAQLALNPAANFHRRRLYRGAQTTMPAYNAANVLQIQRLAFEGQGQCNQWEMASPDDIIPVTCKGRDLEFGGLGRQAAPAPLSDSSKERSRGTSYDKLQQTSSTGEVSQETVLHKLMSHGPRAGPNTYERSVTDSQDASMMEAEQGYRFD